MPKPKIRLILLTGLMILACGILPPQTWAAANDGSLAGAWIGDLSVSGTELGLVFKITSNPDGTYAGTLDVPMQGAKDIPMSKISVQGLQVRIEIVLIGALYTGNLSEDGLIITGQWQQGGASLPLVMRRTEQAPELKRPQEPQPPYPYLEEDVAYENKEAGIKLAGTLTLPQGDGPFPAVILITGSGAQDRNETILGHKPFLVLADYLTRRCIAVLRVDDRGVGGSSGNPALATSADLAGDVLAGVNYLKSRTEINPGRIGLIGHSEGGLIAPIAAVESKDVAFIVLMAGPGLPGEDIILMQTELILRANGVAEPRISAETGIQKQIFTVLKSTDDKQAAAAEIRKILRSYIDTLPQEEREQLGQIDAYIEAQIQAISSPWYQFFLTYDPRPTLRRVSCPILAINGELDLQVPYAENLAAIETACKAGRNKDYTVKSLPGLNHLFQTCQTGSPNEYGLIEETIAPAALQIMGDWIIAHVR